MPDSSILVAVADAMTQALAGATFGDVEFIPERSYADWDEELEQSNCLRVDIVPVGITQTELETRDSVVYDCAVDVGIRKKFGQEDATQCGRIAIEEVDRLVMLAEQIHEFFLQEHTRRLPGYTEAAWLSTTIRTAYSRKMLRDHRQFFGVIRVTYQVAKQL